MARLVGDFPRSLPARGRRGGGSAAKASTISFIVSNAKHRSRIAVVIMRPLSGHISRMIFQDPVDDGGGIPGGFPGPVGGLERAMTSGRRSDGTMWVAAPKPKRPRRRAGLRSARDRSRSPDSAAGTIRRPHPGTSRWWSPAWRPWSACSHPKAAVNRQADTASHGHTVDQRDVGLPVGVDLVVELVLLKEERLRQLARLTAVVLDDASSQRDHIAAGAEARSPAPSTTTALMAGSAAQAASCGRACAPLAGSACSASGDGDADRAPRLEMDLSLTGRCPLR